MLELDKTPDEARDAFVTGWKVWVAFGTEEVLGTAAGHTGHFAAAFYNDHGGGPRPTDAMADEFAEDWLKAGMPYGADEIAEWLKGGAK